MENRLTSIKLYIDIKPASRAYKYPEVTDIRQARRQPSNPQAALRAER